jgi:hypothetical protein
MGGRIAHSLPAARCIQSSIPTDSVYRINGAAKKALRKGNFLGRTWGRKRKKAARSYRQAALARNLLFSGRSESAACMPHTRSPSRTQLAVASLQKVQHIFFLLRAGAQDSRLVADASLSLLPADGWSSRQLKMMHLLSKEKAADRSRFFWSQACISIKAL